MSPRCVEADMIPGYSHVNHHGRAELRSEHATKPERSFVSAPDVCSNGAEDYAKRRERALTLKPVLS